MSGIIDTLTGKSGRDAAKSSERAAGITAEGQRESLDYLKEVEALPLEMRNKFLPQYADIMQGGQAQQDLINTAQQSPLYQAIMGGQQVGEDTIMRNASMTGGIRSGNVSADLTDYGSQLSDQALLQSYDQQLQGIQGLANISLNTNKIAAATAAPSATIGQGIVAGAQAQQNANQSLTNNLFGLGGAALISDIRLKDNIKFVGRNNGFNLYTWDWTEEAKELFGMQDKGRGVMAHEVYDKMPDAISSESGFIKVDYNMIGLQEEAV